jgi:hypothetical protein
LGLSDVQVLVHAAEHGQAVVTHNNRDFRALHEAWVTWRHRWSAEAHVRTGTHVDFSQHSGIVIAPPIPIYDLAHIVEEFMEAEWPMADRLYVWDRTVGWHEVNVGPSKRR